MNPTLKFICWLAAVILFVVVAVIRRASIDGLLSALAAALFVAPFMADAAEAM